MKCFVFFLDEFSRTCGVVKWSGHPISVPFGDFSVSKVIYGYPIGKHNSSGKCQSGGIVKRIRHQRGVNCQLGNIWNHLGDWPQRLPLEMILVMFIEWPWLGL